MAKEKICGIYCIENLVNGKRYIGQSVDIYARWAAHRWKLNNKQHNNLHLTQAWQKYGESNFIFKIVERCDRSKLNEREVYWISKFQTYTFGYNLTTGGSGCLGRVYTESQILDKCYAIFQLDLNGNIIEKWNRASDAADALNICCRSIQSVAGPGDEHKTAGGFIWVYEKDYADFNIKQIKDLKASSVNQYSLDWKYIRSYSSMALAEKDGYGAAGISAVCRGQYRQAYGYIWTYADIACDIDVYIEWYNDHFDVNYIGQYDTIGNLIKIWSCAEDTKMDGFSPTQVRANIRGKYKKHKGYIFKNITWKEYQKIIKENKKYGE